MAYNEYTTKEDLFALLDFMESIHVPVLVHGGWALEALTGASRKHGDIDLLADEKYRDTLIKALGDRVVEQHLHKLEVNFNGAEIDLVFFQIINNRGITITPRIIAQWSDDFISRGLTGAIDGRTIKIISERSLYALLANTVRKKKDMLEKNRGDLGYIEKLLSEEDRNAMRRLFPIENTFWNRLRLRLGIGF